ncbi:hypothetical protein AOP6_0158 [Desulfuromonas sp. AOP6]|nr:hypothetical protein AOP6_0158 [Desulfuromonas sp. AOP6]
MHTAGQEVHRLRRLPEFYPLDFDFFDDAWRRLKKAPSGWRVDCLPKVGLDTFQNFARLSQGLGLRPSEGLNNGHRPWARFVMQANRRLRQVPSPLYVADKVSSVGIVAGILCAPAKRLVSEGWWSQDIPSWQTKDDFQRYRRQYSLEPNACADLIQTGSCIQG